MGPLTAWSEEAMLQLLYHRNPADAYEMRIEESWQCADMTGLLT